MNSTQKKRLVLLDSHAILHRAYHALPDFATSKGEPTGALYGMATMIIGIIEQFKPDYIVATFDLPKPTYRHEAYKEYKAGRAKTDENLIAQIKRAPDMFAALSIPMYSLEGFEADDMLGTIVEQMKKNDDLEIVIASGDMDTLQLVVGDKVKVFTLKKGIKDTVVYNEKAVFDRFGFGPEMIPDYKGLRGDPSDNIIGIKGIGEKTATTLITTFGSIEEMYKKLAKDEQAFLDAKITPRIIELLKNGEEEAFFSKTLATIRRDAPIDFVLPEKEWKTDLDMTQVSTLFSELEFRTLVARLKNAMGEKSETKDDVPKKEIPVVDANKLKTVGIALWLLNSNLTDPKIEDVLDFAKTDDFETAEKIIFAELEKRQLKEVFEKIEKPLIPLLSKMKDVGIKVDVPYLKTLSSEYHEELSKLEKSIWVHAGKEFNVASPKQLGEILFVDMGLKVARQKKTATGAFSTKESELEKIRELHPIIDEVLKHRELSKLLGTYIDTLPALVDETSRIHAQFVQTGTTTGRMSSQDPNLQNIPNKTEKGRAIRKAFVAEKGYTLVAFDYSQIELRIAAFLSKDKKLVEIFRNGKDVHSAVAAQVFCVPESEVTKEMRSRAKVINFGILYGMGVLALKQNLGTSREEAQKFYNDYFETFSGLALYLDQVKADALRLGYTETLFGRRRYFEGLKSRIPFVRAMAERMAINAPIQGTEADIVKIAMIHVDEHLQKKGIGNDVRMLLQVHDELVFEIKTEKVSDIIPEIKQIMESVVDPKKTEGIICTVDAKAGENWEEMEKIK